MRRKPLAALCSLGILVGAAFALGCTVITDFPQCRDHSDCAVSAGAFRVCEANECIVRPSASEVECESRQKCVDYFDEDFTCVSGRCSALTSTECPTVWRPEGSDPDVYVGAVFDLGSRHNLVGAQASEAATLALADFHRAGGLGDGRALGLVVCESQGDPGRGRAAVEHLARNEVRAIIGPTDARVFYGLRDLLVQNEMLAVTPNLSVADLHDSDDGLTWRLSTGDELYAEAAARLAPIVDPENATTDPYQVLLLIPQYDSAGFAGSDGAIPFSRRLEEVMASEAIPANVGTLTYRTPEQYPSVVDMYDHFEERVNAGWAHAPRLLIVLGDAVAKDLILAFLLRRERAKNPMDELYEPEFATNEYTPHIITIFDGGEGAREIFVGTNDKGQPYLDGAYAPILAQHTHVIEPIARDSTQYSGFAERFVSEFDDAPNRYAGFTYDATMLVALTYAGVSGSPTGGRQLADVMPRLVGDSQDVVGYGSDPQSLAGIRETIAAGGRVLLRGATGLLKFDLQTRDLERDLDGLELEVQSDALGAVQDAQFTSARLYEWVSGSNGQWVATP